MITSEEMGTPHELTVTSRPGILPVIGPFGYAYMTGKTPVMFVRGTKSRLAGGLPLKALRLTSLRSSNWYSGAR